MGLLEKLGIRKAPERNSLGIDPCEQAKVQSTEKAYAEKFISLLFLPYSSIIKQPTL